MHAQVPTQLGARPPGAHEISWAGVHHRTRVTNLHARSFETRGGPPYGRTIIITTTTNVAPLHADSFSTLTSGRFTELTHKMNHTKQDSTPTSTPIPSKGNTTTRTNDCTLATRRSKHYTLSYVRDAIAHAPHQHPACPTNESTHGVVTTGFQRASTHTTTATLHPSTMDLTPRHVCAHDTQDTQLHIFTTTASDAGVVHTDTTHFTLRTQHYSQPHAWAAVCWMARPSRTLWCACATSIIRPPVACVCAKREKGRARALGLG